MKYKITDIEMYWHGRILHRIESLKDFILINGKEIRKGDLGGWIESENNLSQEGSCWIYDECMMYENARRSENSIGYGNSHQFDNSQQYGNSQQFEDSRQSGDSQQFGNSIQFGKSKADKDMSLSGNSLFETEEDIVILTSPTSGMQITIGSDKNICTGCFDGSSWFMIDENRCQLPKDHWAFSLHRQLLEGKFKDIKLKDGRRTFRSVLLFLFKLNIMKYLNHNNKPNM